MLDFSYAAILLYGFPDVPSKRAVLEVLMGQSSGNKVFEEINPFPEKVADSLSIDGDEITIPDDSEITGSHEEILLSEDISARPSKPIEDENIPGGFKNRSSAPATDIFDIESLSREIDSMGAFSANVEENISKKEFWDVLDDEEIKMIDDVSLNSGDSFLDTLEPVNDLGMLDTGDDKALLIQEKEETETSPLWLENNDFVITEVEGFGDIRPKDFISTLQSGALNKKAAKSAGTVSAVIPDVFIDDSQILSAEPSVPVQKPKTASTKRKYEDIDIPFIIVDAGPVIPEYEESVNDRGIIELEAEDAVPVPQSVPKSVPVPAKKEVKVPDSISLKPIDLGEAEKIAREDMVILNEDDLIEELETYDLTPAKEEQKTVTSITRNFDYLTPKDSAITESHRSSIEADVQSDNAVIIEENVDDIYAKLGNMTKVIVDNKKEEVIDITDRIVILDDGSSMETFLETMPEHKRDDMKKLLEYLDGLFDKLPEDVVKRFADSEYFDLYVNVMNELEGR